jgi:hypothetical protein
MKKPSGKTCKTCKYWRAVNSSFMGGYCENKKSRMVECNPDEICELWAEYKKEPEKTMLGRIEKLEEWAKATDKQLTGHWTNINRIDGEIIELQQQTRQESVNKEITGYGSWRRYGVKHGYLPDEPFKISLQRTKKGVTKNICSICYEEAELWEGRCSNCEEEERINHNPEPDN